MGIGDKISNAAEEAAGKAKETVGRVSGKRRLEAEGAVEQLAAKGKKVVEHVKDSATHAVEEIKKITK